MFGLCVNDSRTCWNAYERAHQQQERSFGKIQLYKINLELRGKQMALINGPLRIALLLYYAENKIIASYHHVPACGGRAPSPSGRGRAPALSLAGPGRLQLDSEVAVRRLVTLAVTVALAT